MISRILILILLISLGGCVAGKNTAMQETPDRSKLLQGQIDLGLGYIRNGEYQRAKENLNRALSLDPKSPVAHNAFGLLFQLEGEDELAEEYFNRAIRFDSSFSQARNNYGAFLFSQERYDEAIEQLLLASKDRFYRGRPSSFENLGIAYLRRGNLKSAEDAFIRSIELNPGQPRSLLELAYLRFDQQNFIAAKDLFRRYIQVAQQNSRSLWLGIRLARRFGEKDAEASYTLMLKNIFPASEEFKLLQESGDD